MNIKRVTEALLAIVDETDTEVEEIISALIGVAWDEEDGSTLVDKAYEMLEEVG